MSRTLTKTLLQVIFLGLVLSLALGLNYLYAWTGPQNTPPTCPAGQIGCDTPLNVGTTNQVKDANLSVGHSANTASDFGLISYGKIRSTIGGVQFPDGTVQVTAASGTGGGSAGALSADDFMHIQDQKPSGTLGQVLTNTWNIRQLNTDLTNTISGASRSGNQITLPAGTYYVEGGAQAFQPSYSKTVFYNVTTASNVIIGENAYGDNAGDGYVTAKFSGLITTTATNVFEVRHRITQSSKVGGSAASLGVVEVYTDVKIWKVN